MWADPLPNVRSEIVAVINFLDRIGFINGAEVALRAFPTNAGGLSAPTAPKIKPAVLGYKQRRDS